MNAVRVLPFLFVGSILLGCSATPRPGQGMEDRRLADEGAGLVPSSTGTSATFPLSGSTVVFYNAENLFDTQDDPVTDDADLLPDSKLQWTEDRLRTKLEHLAEAIGMTGKDLPVLVGLCEVENRSVVERLAKETTLKKAHYAVVHEDSPDERGIDVALMFDADLFALMRSQALHVPLDDDRTRDILHIELSTGEHLFHVFVNHWPSRREGLEKSGPKRMSAARVLRQAVEAIPSGPNIHVLIMGDFNDTPIDRSITEGLGAGCALNSQGLIDLMCVGQQEGAGSHQYNGAWDYLDQFIVDPGLVRYVRHARALKDGRLLFDHPKYGPSPDKTYSGGHYKGGYSDHLPIVLTFK